MRTIITIPFDSSNVNNANNSSIWSDRRAVRNHLLGLSLICCAQRLSVWLPNAVVIKLIVSIEQLVFDWPQYNQWWLQQTINQWLSFDENDKRFNINAISIESHVSPETLWSLIALWSEIKIKFIVKNKSIRFSLRVREEEKSRNWRQTRNAWVIRNTEVDRAQMPTMVQSFGKLVALALNLNQVFQLHFNCLWASDLLITGEAHNLSHRGAQELRFELFLR